MNGGSLTIFELFKLLTVGSGQYISGCCVQPWGQPISSYIHHSVEMMMMNLPLTAFFEILCVVTFWKKRLFSYSKSEDHC